MRRTTTSLLVLVTVALGCFPFTVNATPKHPMRQDAFAQLMRKASQYKGEEQPGLSSSSLREKFKELVEETVKKFMVKSVGGSIEEFGMRDRRHWMPPSCDKRPALTMADVTNLARKSFGIGNFQPRVPPCTESNGGTVKQCNYDVGKCCQRYQVDFIGRYYDTAIAAMGLGATKEEAFATLMHARALAFSLQACDPDISKKGYFRENNVEWATVWSDGRAATGTWHGSELSVISFPQSYEVLYELYNTMLIERLRSRRTTHFPSHAQMQALKDEVYYKKLVARVTRLHLELHADLAFPTSDDFVAAGLTMATSSRILSSRIVPVDDSDASLLGDFNFNTTLRSSAAPVTVYEMRTRRKRSMNLANCNLALPHEYFFQFKFRYRVWSKYEACCAKECAFLAHYGGTFSAGSANCCAGCNRASCKANSGAIASLLAEESAIESPSKYNAGVKEMAFSV